MRDNTCEISCLGTLDLLQNAVSEATRERICEVCMFVFLSVSIYLSIYISIYIYIKYLFLLENKSHKLFFYFSVKLCVCAFMELPSSFPSIM